MLLPTIVPTNQNRLFKLRSWAHFLNVADGSVQSVPGGSLSNPQEAMITQSLVQTLLRRIPAANILIITPYRRQLQVLKELARQNGWDGVDVMTPDALHGAERQIVILNTVRTSGGSGLLADRRRANVCTSRAVEVFYVVGKWQVFEHELSSFSFLRAVLLSLRARIPGFVVDASSVASS